MTGNQTCDINFNGPDAIALTERRTVTADDAGWLYGSVSLVTANGVGATMNAAPHIGGTSFQYAVVPTTALAGGDLYALNAYRLGTDNGRHANRFFRTPGDQQVTLPPSPQPAEFTQGAAMPCIQWDRYPNAVAYRLSMGDNNPTLAKGLAVYLTPGWLPAGMADRYRYDLPNFDGVDGWNPQWTFALNATTAFTQCSVLTGNMSMQQWLANIFANGNNRRDGMTYGEVLIASPLGQ